MPIASSWQSANTIVFGPAAAPVAWTDLDISAVVGEREVLALICIDPAAGASRVAFRPNGDGDDYYMAVTGAGSSSVNYNAASYSSSVLVKTDTSGVVEWKAGAADNLTVTVIGFVTNPGNGLGTNVSAGALGAAAWNGVDCSGVIGSRRCFVFLKITTTNAWNANEYWITRWHSDADNWINATTPEFAYNAANKVRALQNAKVSTLVVESDDTGEIEIYCAMGVGTANVEVMCYVPLTGGWNVPSGSGNVFGPANAPNAWTDLDISSVVGKDNVLALIKVERISGVAGGTYCRFRENGSADPIGVGSSTPQAIRTLNNRTAFVVVTTDSDGICEWDVNPFVGNYSMELTVVGWIGPPIECDATWSGMKTTGKGKMALFVEIAGYPNALSTVDDYPHYTDAWFYGVYDDCMPWLKWDQQRIVLDERWNPIEGTLDVQPITLAVTDLHDAMTESLGANWFRNMTRLTATLGAAGVTATVDSTAGFDTSGVIWVDQEAIEYTGTTPTTFTGLIRGVYGTTAVEHTVDEDARPIPLHPAVLDGPQYLAGRRCVIHAAAIGCNGCIGVSEIIYRGFVGPDIKPGEGQWNLTIDHISKLFSREVGSGLPTATIRPGYWYSGGGVGISNITIIEDDVPAGTELYAEATVTIGRYAGPQDLLEEVQAQFAVAQVAAGFGRYVFPAYNPDIGKMQFRSLGTVGGAERMTVKVVEGDPLWALGFDAGDYVFERQLSPALTTLDAQRDPHIFVCETSHGSYARGEPQIWLDDVGEVRLGQYAMIGPNAYMQTHTQNPAGHGEGYVTFYTGSIDPMYRDRTEFICIDEQEDLVFRHVFRFGVTDTIVTAMKKMLGHYVGMTEPKEWTVQGMDSDDIDFNELDDCLENVPVYLTRFHDVISDPVTLSEMICDRLGMLGIAPRITVFQSRIGFARLETPSITDASSVIIDDDVWERSSAAQIRMNAEGVALLSRISVEHTSDYREGDLKFAMASKITSVTMANERGKTFTRVYRARGLHVSDAPIMNMPQSESELIHVIAARAIGSHLGQYSRLAPVAPIPCVWSAISVACGDIVRVTHPVPVDMTEGSRGLTDRLGVIVSRQATITVNQINQLGIQLPPRVNAAGIAPAALATTWNPGTLTLTVPATTAYQTGGSDLDEFVAGMDVEFEEYDVEVPATWNQTIASVGANSIVLNADPFGGAFPATGVVVRWRSYDNCSADQKLWLFFGDSAYTLGAAADEAYQWGI